MQLSWRLPLLVAIVSSCALACAPTSSATASATSNATSSAPRNVADASAVGEAHVPPIARPGNSDVRADAGRVDGSAAQRDLPTAALAIATTSGPARFRVELARTPRERNIGLMFREQLDDDAGMLFLFEREQRLSFWMKNTYLPLDMIFIDAQMRIVGIVEDAAPQTTTSRGVAGDSKFVLELNAGTVRRLGIAPRQAVTFEGVEAALLAVGKDMP